MSSRSHWVTNDSAILANWLVKHIGRSWSNFGGWHFGMGIIWPLFHCQGTIPCWNDALRISARGWHISQANSRTTRGGTSSDNPALLHFILHNFKYTSWGSTRGHTDGDGKYAGKPLLSRGGRSDATEMKCSLIASAVFFRFSVSPGSTFGTVMHKEFVSLFVIILICLYQAAGFVNFTCEILIL